MIVAILNIWLIPILIIGICIYIDMEKGQSIEEYIDEQGVDHQFMTLVIIVPIVNCVIAIGLIISTIYNKIKHFRK